VTFQAADEWFPWLVRRVLMVGPFPVSSPEELPEEASVDRSTMRRSREQSVLGMPLRIGGETVGVLSFATFRKRQEWPGELVSRLQQMADIFSNVMARKKADEELQLAYSKIGELNERLEQENLYLRKEISVEHNHSNVVGQSKAIRDILKLAEQVAATDSAVLIQGETGTGKELLARTIHDLSSRKARSMVKINCAALPATLIESELFGREKGAYTGALSREVGRFELADRSTIFLDEIGELPMELQVKLLRVLQEGELQRLGSSKTHHVDVRVIAATNRDLAAAVTEGRFREDLYYRLSVFPIHVPPLRERPEDIQELVWHILQDLGKRMGKNIHSIQSSTLKAFQSYAWPGNVRELRNIIEWSGDIY
jgi:formate hydrogenlyase transcriptional activator